MKLLRAKGARFLFPRVPRASSASSALSLFFSHDRSRVRLSDCGAGGYCWRAMDVVHTIDAAGWNGPFAPDTQAGACDALERGKVLFFPRLEFRLDEHERL